MKFPKTRDKIRELFPGDDNKDFRHDLYTFIHDIPLGKVSKTETVMHFFDYFPKYTAPLENAHILDVMNLKLIEKIYDEERAGMMALPEMIEEIAKEFCQNNKSFSAHELTQEARKRVNNSRHLLLTDRDTEEIEIIPGSGVKGFTQKIPHEEVRTILQSLIADDKIQVDCSISGLGYKVYTPKPVLVMSP